MKLPSEVHGFGLGDGISQRLRLVLAPLRCGQAGSGTPSAWTSSGQDVQRHGVLEGPARNQS